MVGNVWEWVHSLFKRYPYNSNDGREDEKASGSRALRGGCFDLEDRFVRCAFRSWYSPNSKYVNIGFRVVVAPPIEEIIKLSK
jgi:formylglycine-generating enzyme required for sulfatase activity